MDTHEVIYPVKLDELTYSFKLQNNGNLCNFYLCSHPLIIYLNYNDMTVKTKTPNMLVTNVYLCIDNNTIVQLTAEPVYEQTQYIYNIEATHRTNCTFFLHDYPLHTNNINSNNITIVFTFASPPLSTFWLEYDNLFATPVYNGPILTHNNRTVNYQFGQIYLY